jgi:hypothetical protein
MAASFGKAAAAFERIAHVIEKAQDREGQARPVRKRNPTHKPTCTCEECFRA